MFTRNESESIRRNQERKREGEGLHLYKKIYVSCAQVDVL